MKNCQRLLDTNHNERGIDRYVGAASCGAYNGVLNSMFRIVEERIYQMSP